MTGGGGGKLGTAVTVKLDEGDVEALDAEVRRRSERSNVPISRSVVLRALVRERLAEIVELEEERAG